MLGCTLSKGRGRQEAKNRNARKKCVSDHDVCRELEHTDYYRQRTTSGQKYMNKGTMGSHTVEAVVASSAKEGRGRPSGANGPRLKGNRKEEIFLTIETSIFSDGASDGNASKSRSNLNHTLWPRDATVYCTRKGAAGGLFCSQICQ